MSRRDRLRGFFRDGPTGEVETHRIWSAALVAIGVVANVVVDRAEGGWTLWVSIVATLVVAAGVWWLGERRAASLQAVASGARAETLLDLGHSLAPIAQELGRVSAMSTGTRRAQRSGLRKLILSAASGLADVRLRACYFALDEDGKSMHPAGDVGRSIPPKAGFHAGVKSGDAALAMIKDGGFLFCDNVDESPPPGWVPSNHGAYQTFISVTVGTPGAPAGMLTLDAPKAGDLTAEDVEMMLVLGHLLGIAEQITK